MVIVHLAFINPASFFQVLFIPIELYINWFSSLYFRELYTGIIEN